MELKGKIKKGYIMVSQIVPEQTKTDSGIIVSSGIDGGDAAIPKIHPSRGIVVMGDEENGIKDGVTVAVLKDSWSMNYAFAHNRKEYFIIPVSYVNFIYEN